MTPWLTTTTNHCLKGVMEPSKRWTRAWNVNNTAQDLLDVCLRICWVTSHLRGHLWKRKGHSWSAYPSFSRDLPTHSAHLGRYDIAARPQLLSQVIAWIVCVVEMFFSEVYIIVSKLNVYVHVIRANFFVHVVERTFPCGAPAMSSLSRSFLST